MRWKLIEAPDSDDTALTDAELLGLSILAAQECTPGDVYYRAWEKIQPQVEIAIQRGNP